MSNTIGPGTRGNVPREHARLAQPLAHVDFALRTLLERDRAECAVPPELEEHGRTLQRA